VRIAVLGARYLILLRSAIRIARPLPLVCSLLHVLRCIHHVSSRFLPAIRVARPAALRYLPPHALLRVLLLPAVVTFGLLILDYVAHAFAFTQFHAAFVPTPPTTVTTILAILLQLIMHCVAVAFALDLLVFTRVLVPLLPDYEFRDSGLLPFTVYQLTFRFAMVYVAVYSFTTAAFTIFPFAFSRTAVRALPAHTHIVPAVIRGCATRIPLFTDRFIFNCLGFVGAVQV